MKPQEQLRLAKDIVEMLLDLEKHTAKLRADIEDNGVAPAVDSANTLIRRSLNNMTADYEAVRSVIRMEQESGLAMHSILTDAPKCRPTTIIK